MSGKPYRPFNPGRWTLERERHQIPPGSPPPEDRTTPIAEVVGRVVQRMGLGDRLWEQRLLSDWPAMVGAQIALHTRPGRMDRGVLTVFVDHPVWMAELSRGGRKEILERIRTAFGSERIKDIRFTIDPEPSRKKA